MQKIAVCIFCFLLITEGCIRFPPHEIVLVGEMNSYKYSIIYSDSASRGFQNGIDTVLFRLKPNDNSASDSIEALLKSYGLSNYSITINERKKTSGLNFKGEPW